MKNPNAVVDLSRELISCASVTPEDAGAQNILAQRLEKSGFEVTKLSVRGVQSLWARFGKVGPLLVFAGHTDVVPPGELSQWTSPPFEPVVRDDKLFGRGVCDMKGNIAAFIVAIEEFLKGSPQLPFSIGVLIAGDEEGEINHGTTDILEWLHYHQQKIDYCIVAEPTSVEVVGDTIKIGRRGSLTGKLKLIGIQGHAAYPDRAKNPIMLSLKGLEELCAEEWDKGSAEFPPTRLQITGIHAGTGAANVIPGLMEVLFNLRFSTQLIPETIQRRCEAIFKKIPVPYQIEWILGAEPFLTEKGPFVELMKKAVKDEVGIVAELSTSGGTSDARFVAQTGAQVLELGVTNASMHQVNEWVAVDELMKLSRIFKRLLDNFSAL